jgi:hypothetical protein
MHVTHVDSPNFSALLLLSRLFPPSSLSTPALPPCLTPARATCALAVLCLCASASMLWRLHGNSDG